MGRIYSDNMVARNGEICGIPHASHGANLPQQYWVRVPLRIKSQLAMSFSGETPTTHMQPEEGTGNETNKPKE